MLAIARRARVCSRLRLVRLASSAKLAAALRIEFEALNHSHDIEASTKQAAAHLGMTAKEYGQALSKLLQQNMHASDKASLKAAKAYVALQRLRAAVKSSGARAASPSRDPEPRRRRRRGHGDPLESLLAEERAHGRDEPSTARGVEVSEDDVVRVLRRVTRTSAALILLEAEQQLEADAAAREAGKDPNERGPAQARLQMRLLPTLSPVLQYCCEEEGVDGRGFEVVFERALKQAAPIIVDEQQQQEAILTRAASAASLMATEGRLREAAMAETGLSAADVAHDDDI